MSFMATPALADTGTASGTITSYAMNGDSKITSFVVDGKTIKIGVPTEAMTTTIQDAKRLEWNADVSWEDGISPLLGAKYLRQIVVT